MIDFIKIHSLAVNAEKLLNNERLTFPLSNIAYTGEVLNRWQPAQYRGLTFKVKGNIVQLKFSPHKYFEGGKTNFRDFQLKNIQDVIFELSATFEFDPEKSVLNFIEIGVNVKTDIDPNKLIDCFICYKNIPFEHLKVKNKGYGRICSTQQFDIKVYNKSLQNDLEYHLLRFEVKVKRMRFLERYGIKSLTIADLTKLNIYTNLKTMILDVFNGILMYNPEITRENFKNQKDRELFIEGRSAKYWQTLERTKRHRQIKRFAELAESDKIKKELYKLISEKCNELTTCTNDATSSKLQQNNRFYESVKNEDLQQNNLSINCYNVVQCPVTGLTFKNQKKNSINLSPQSVKWYFENEPKTYRNILLPFLTKKWLIKNAASPNEIYFTEIAHQIRNKKQNPKNNPRNNTKNSFNKIELKGLKLWQTIDLIDPGKKKYLQLELID